MNLEIKDIITLEDDKEYLITSIATYENDDYFYLVDINEHSNVKFCKLLVNNDADFLLEIEDDNLLAQIIPILLSTIQDEIRS